MSDISEQQMDDLIGAMNKSAGSLGQIADNFSKNSTQRQSATPGISNQIRQARLEDAASTKAHSNAVQNAAKSIQGFITRIGGIFSAKNITTEAINYGKELTHTYRDLSDYGQNFSGSILRMGQMAAKAGLPLEQFAAAIKHNSVVVNQLGVGRFADLSKSMRKLTQQAGFYGYTVDQLNDFGLDYLETQRKAGKNLSTFSNDAMTHRITSFALNVTAASDALGAQRDEVMRMTMDDLRQESVAATSRINSARGLNAYNEAIEDAVAQLNAQPGAASALGKGLADAFASINGSMSTDLGKAFIESGQQNGVALIDNATKRLKAGENAASVTSDLVNKLGDQLQDTRTLDNLKLLAQSTGQGAEGAKKLLGIAADLQKYSAKDLDDKKKARASTDNLTSFMLSFGNTLQGLKSSLIDGFLTPFMSMGQLDPNKIKEFWKQIDDMGPTLKDFGQKFGELAKSLLTKENLQMFGDAVIGVTGFLIDATRAIGGFVSMITGVIKAVHDAVEGVLGPKFAGLATVLTGLTLWFGSKILAKAIMNFFARSISGNLVNVKGRIVNVSGGAGGGGMAGGALEAAEDVIGGKGGRGAARRRALLKKGMKQKLTGSALRDFVRAGEAKPGLIARAASKLPGASALAKIGGRLGGVGKVMGGPLKAIGKFGGPITAALVAGLTIADAANTIKDIHEQVAAGKMSPKEARVALGKMAGSTSGSLAGSVIGGLIGQALIPIPGVGAAIGAGVGALAGDFIGGKIGGAIGGALPITDKGPAGIAAASRVAGAAQPNAVTANPRIIDDRVVASLRTDALLGDKTASDQLRKIEDALKNQTAVLASVQARNLQATRDTASAVRSTGGFAAG